MGVGAYAARENSRGVADPGYGPRRHSITEDCHDPLTKRAAVVVLLLAVTAGTSAGEGQDRGGLNGATVAGSVFDPSGAAVPAAQVTLTFTDGTPPRVATSGSDGWFTVVQVPPGSHGVTVQAQGFAPFATRPFILTSRDGFTLPPITLSIEDVTASVIVRPIEAIAEEQIRAQEKQRLFAVFGFVPKFYVSYIRDAAPLASRQKLSLASRHTFDWTSFAGATVSAAIQQAVDAHSGYGRGALEFPGFSEPLATQLMSCGGGPIKQLPTRHPVIPFAIPRTLQRAVERCEMD